MIKKLCKHCKKNKKEISFRKGRTICKLCETTTRKEYQKQYQKDNSVHIKQIKKEYHKQYQIKNADRLKIYRQKYWASRRKNPNYKPRPRKIKPIPKVFKHPLVLKLELII